MARYKYIDTSPRFLPVDLARQLIPGTFEHAVNHLLEHAVDLSSFDARFQNDETGAPAYPPGMLLKVVLCAYSHGVVSSRGIERLCREHVTFIALCGDSAPHFTTIAHFVSTLGEDIARVFAAVVAICDQQGLIGREMFAIDGVKLPSNASKQRSGTRADFERQAAKLEVAMGTLVKRHRAADELPPEADLSAKEVKRIERLERDAGQLREWLAANPEERRGPTGGVRKSNRTDNESAKMATNKGVIQGYTGVAAVDQAHQIIVEAQAHGTGAEQEVLLPMVEAMQPMLSGDSLITADSGYHSEANLQALGTLGVEALIADNEMRRRDERFATQERHQQGPDPLYDKRSSESNEEKFTLYQPSDFTHDPEAGTCVCPAGKTLRCTGIGRITNGYIGDHFSGSKRDCLPCAHRELCLRTPETTPVRQVAFFRGKVKASKESHTSRMKRRIDSQEGRARYERRFGTVEPVFANVRHNKRLDRFTLRGRTKVDAQWKLFCLVHNIEKLAKLRYRS